MKKTIAQVPLFPKLGDRPYLFQITGNRGGVRAYQLPGSSEPYWSVTGVLGNTVAKPALQGWYNKQGREAVTEVLSPTIGKLLTSKILDDSIEQAKKRPYKTSRESADVGTRAHDLFHRHIVNARQRRTAPGGYRIQATQFATDLHIVYESFLEFEKSHISKWLASEFAVYSSFFGYAGSVDALAMDNEGRYMVIDFKTGSRLYPENALQVAAYANALSIPLAEATNDNLEWDTWDMLKPYVVRLGKAFVEVEAKQVTNPQLALDGFLHALGLWISLGYPGIGKKAKTELEEHFSLSDIFPSVW